MHVPRINCLGLIINGCSSPLNKSVANIISVKHNKSNILTLAPNHSQLHRGSSSLDHVHSGLIGFFSFLKLLPNRRENMLSAPGSCFYVE